MNESDLKSTLSYEDAQCEAIDRATAVKIYGIPLSAPSGDTARRFVRIVGCICVQDSPENPCPCEGPIIWIPRDGILTTERSSRKGHDGQSLAVITVASDAKLVLERQSTVSAATVAQLGNLRRGRARRVAMMARARGGLSGGGARGTAGAILGAFLVGYELGTKIDEATGASDWLADTLWGWFGDEDND